MIFHLLVAGSMAGLTWLLGWWGVAVAALILGFVFRDDDGRAWQVALGASEGWAILLVIDLLLGPLGRVESTLGGAMRIPGPALLLATLLFPALIGWSGAAAASEIGRRLLRRRDAVKTLHA